MSIPAPLKLIFASLGIKVSSVKFDTENQLIVATFTHGGETHTKNIPFSEVETLFTEAPQDAQAAAGDAVAIQRVSAQQA